MKPSIFISHISEEKELALIYKRHIFEDFAGQVDVFVSSDSVSINAGEPWLNAIQNALEKSQIEMIICSQASTRQPWVNFEAGGGWFKGVTIVPVCHTDMSPENLPMPLNLLQSIKAADRNDLKQLYTLIAKTIHAAVPEIDFSMLHNEVSSFEENYKSSLPKVYTRKNVINRSIMSFLAGVIGLLVIFWGIKHFGRNELVKTDKLDTLEKQNVSLIADSLRVRNTQRKVIVLMDSPLPLNVYKENKAEGETNSDDIYNIISKSDKLNDALIFTERVYPTWKRYEAILKMKPDLIIIHYSAFRNGSSLEAEYGSMVKFRNFLRQVMDSLDTRFLIYTRKEINVRNDLERIFKGSTRQFTKEELRRVDFVNVTNPPCCIGNCVTNYSYIDFDCHPEEAGIFKSKAENLLIQPDKNK